jgi:hypothetical protein
MTPTDPHPLEAIEPQNTRAVAIQGKMVTVRPIRVGQIPAFSRALARASGLLGMLTKDVAPEDMIAMIGDHGDALIDAAQVALGIPRETLEQSEPGEFIECVAAVITVNRDFFARQVSPALLARLHESAGQSGVGSTPSTP